MSEIVIRPYKPLDRAVVRHICCETANAGKPVEGFFHDRELIADLVTRYYTDFEPQHSWVAVRNGQVVGYLNGSMDGRRALRMTLWCIVPGCVMGALCHATFCRRETWRLLWACLRTLWARGLRWSGASSGGGRHLHVNLTPEARGAKVGTRLVERFIEQVGTSGGRMVEASVRGDNVAARRFFERIGFTELTRQKLVLPTPAGYQVTSAITYAKRW